MYITFMNGNGGGFANKIYTEKNTTLADFLEAQIPGFESRQFDIAVNGKVAMGDYILCENDRVVAAYKGQKGA